MHPQDIALTCQKKIVEFVAARQASIPLIHDQLKPREWDRSDFQIWQKPVDSWMKFNCDGAWMQAHIKGGAGWVARDSNGWMDGNGMGCRGFFIPVDSSYGSKSSAEAMTTGLEARVIRMMVETDCKQLVAMIHGNMKTDTTIDNIIHDIKLMASHVISFAFVNHRCNATAHLIAAHVSHVGSP